jgi:hypothetical protein
MSTLRRILLVLVLCGLALGYLYQHNYSMRLTRRVNDLGKVRQLLAESLDRVSVEVADLSGFERLESLWVAGGRQAALPGARPDSGSGQAAAVVRHAGQD